MSKAESLESTGILERDGRHDSKCVTPADEARRCRAPEGTPANQNFPTAFASADEKLKAGLEPAERANFVHARNRAQVAAEVPWAIDLANPWNVPGAREMQQYALCRGEDSRMRAQIQAVLDQLAAPRHAG